MVATRPPIRHLPPCGAPAEPARPVLVVGVAERQRTPPAPAVLATAGGVERIARAALVVAGGLALGGLSLLGATIAWLLAGSLLGFLWGPGSPLDLSKGGTSLLYFFPPFALASGALTLAWVLVARGSAAQPWRGWSLARLVAALERRRWWLGVLVAGLTVYLLYARLVFLYYRLAGGTDEGLYLVAARYAMAGGLAYRDFAFLQGPLHPYLIGPLLVPFGFDERAARALAILGTLLSLLLTAWTATRMGGRLAGLLAFGLLLTSLDYITEQSSGIQPSGALASLCFLLAVLAMARGRPLLALVPLAVAVGMRVLFAPLLLLGILHAALALREARRPVLLGAGLVALVFGPFFVAAPQATWFGVLGLQLGRSELIPRNQVLSSSLVARLQQLHAGALDQLGAYLPFLVLALLAAWAIAWPPLRQQLGRRSVGALAFVALGVSVMALVDLLPYPYISRYPVPQLPLAAVAGGTVLGVAMRSGDGLAARVAAVLAVALMALNPFLATRDGVNSRLEFISRRHTAPVQALEEVAAYVRASTPADGVLITLETPVATQARRALWPGLEMSMWGVLDVAPETARAARMTTPELLAEAIESEQAAAVVTSERNTWRVANLRTRERIRDALRHRYVLAREFEMVSDWGPVQVWLPRRL